MTRETKRASRGNARPNALKRGVANAARAMGGESEVFRAWDQATKSQKRTDLKKIMILGAGPIVIGQVRARDDALGEGGEANGAGWEGVIANASAGAFLNIQNRGGGDREGATRGVATLRGIGANGLVRINCVSFVVSTRARKD